MNEIEWLRSRISMMNNEFKTASKLENTEAKGIARGIWMCQTQLVIRLRYLEEAKKE